jgi:hypothetical protein
LLGDKAVEDAVMEDVANFDQDKMNEDFQNELKRVYNQIDKISCMMWS